MTIRPHFDKDTQRRWHKNIQDQPLAGWGEHLQEIQFELNRDRRNALAIVYMTEFIINGFIGKDLPAYQNTMRTFRRLFLNQDVDIYFNSSPDDRVGVSVAFNTKPGVTCFFPSNFAALVLDPTERIEALRHLVFLARASEIITNTMTTGELSREDEIPRYVAEAQAYAQQYTTLVLNQIVAGGIQYFQPGGFSIN